MRPRLRAVQALASTTPANAAPSNVYAARVLPSSRRLTASSSPSPLRYAVRQCNALFCVAVWPPRRVPRRPACARPRGVWHLPPPPPPTPNHGAHTPCLPAPLLLPIASWACTHTSPPPLGAFVWRCGRSSPGCVDGWGPCWDWPRRPVPHPCSHRDVPVMRPRPHPHAVRDSPMDVDCGERVG